MVKLDRCIGSFNTVNELSNKVCVPKDLNIHAFHLNAGNNKQKF